MGKAQSDDSGEAEPPTDLQITRALITAQKVLSQLMAAPSFWVTDSIFFLLTHYCFLVFFSERESCGNKNI